MALDKTGKPLPKGITWLPKKNLYMGRFAYHKTNYTMYAKTLKDIKKKLNDKRYEVMHDMSDDAMRISLNKWFDIWMESYKIGKVKPTTIDTYFAIYDKHIRTDLGETNIGDIKGMHIQSLYNSFIQSGLSSKYLYTMHAMLSNIFKTAINNELIKSNPCNKAVKPECITSKRRVLSISEQKRLLSFISDDKYSHIEPIFTTLLGTGLRIGELLALTWDDVSIDTSTPTISVNHTLVRVRQRKYGHTVHKLQTPKTKNSIRTIPLQSCVVSALKRQRTRVNFLKTLDRWNPPDGFANLVFPGKKGQPQWRSTISDGLDIIIRKINENELETSIAEDRDPVLMEPVNLHAFRHTFATRCLEANIPAKIVQTWLGHASIEMTLNLYTHVSDDTSVENMRLFEMYMDKNRT